MDRASTPEADAARSLDIATVEAPILLCTSTGTLQAATAPALALLRRVAEIEPPPSRLPSDLWRLLQLAAPGEAVEWRPASAPHELLGCTRYCAAGGSHVLLMREVSAKHVARAEELRRQQVDSTERLVASIAQDIRGSVASVVYSADFLNVSGASVAPTELSETLRDIAKASASLQLTVDALLDYAGLGPSVSVPLSLTDVLHRTVRSLHAHYTAGTHRVRINVAPRGEWVRGNPIVIEQIFFNLLLNSAEATASSRHVLINTFPAPRLVTQRSGSPNSVCIRVWDDGPGIPSELRPFVFDPFFTTKPGRAGLGLTLARQAAESLEGALEVTEAERGACFSLFLPSCEPVP